MNDMFVEVECPHCRHFIRAESSQAKRVDLGSGPPLEICDYCHEPYVTGSKHFEDMPPRERIARWHQWARPALRDGILSGMVAFLLVAGLSFGPGNLHHALFTPLPIAFAAGVILAALYRYSTFPKHRVRIETHKPEARLLALWHTYHRPARKRAA